MSRLVCGEAMFAHRPFSGSGYSLYATVGTSVQYRNLRLLSDGVIGSVQLDYGATNVEKTARRDTIESGDTWALPSSFNSETVTFDIRHYEDDVENATTNYRTVTLDIDGSGNSQSAINGTGTLVATEIQTGGVVVLRMRYYRKDTGIQPNLFRLTRTAGPTAPADVTVSRTVTAPTDLITFTTGALSDSSAYTFKIVAENGSSTKDLITGIAVTADATGPTAPSTATAVVW